MKYFVLMVMAAGLTGCPGISWDIGIGECDGARITQGQRHLCPRDQRVVCTGCDGDRCAQTQCVTLAQERAYLESNDGGLPDGWLPGLGDGGITDGSPPDAGPEAE